MPIRHQLRTATAQCLTIMRRYHDAERTPMAAATMVAEVEMLIGSLIELELPSGMVEAEVLGPVGRELVALYGHELGRRLEAKFVEVFKGAGMSLIYGGERFLVCSPSRSRGIDHQGTGPSPVGV